MQQNFEEALVLVSRADKDSENGKQLLLRAIIKASAATCDDASPFLLNSQKPGSHLVAAFNGFIAVSSLSAKNSLSRDVTSSLIASCLKLDLRILDLLLAKFLFFHFLIPGNESQDREHLLQVYRTCVLRRYLLFLIIEISKVRL